MAVAEYKRKNSGKKDEKLKHHLNFFISSQLQIFFLVQSIIVNGIALLNGLCKIEKTEDKSSPFESIKEHCFSQILIEQRKRDNEEIENNKDDLCQVDEVHKFGVKVNFEFLQKPNVLIRKNVLKGIKGDWLSKGTVHGGFIMKKFDHFSHF